LGDRIKNFNHKDHEVSTISALPILLLFFFAQRTFIEGISLTGIKG
jgi:ABC-type maltose transport system permease subunit